MTTARKPKPVNWATAQVHDTGTGILACVPIRVQSEANLRGAWQTAWRRKKEQWAGLTAVMGSKADAPWTGPLRVTFTRLYTGREKAMDRHDNLPRAFKGCVDWVAKWLGRDDGDAAITWEYLQVATGETGVMVRVELL